MCELQLAFTANTGRNNNSCSGYTYHNILKDQERNVYSMARIIAIIACLYIPLRVGILAVLKAYYHVLFLPARVVRKWSSQMFKKVKMEISRRLRIV